MLSRLERPDLGGGEAWIVGVGSEWERLSRSREGRGLNERLPRRSGNEKLEKQGQRGKGTATRLEGGQCVGGPQTTDRCKTKDTLKVPMKSNN